MNHRRFHFSSVLDGRRARDVLGYEPKHPIVWPRGSLPPVEAETRVARAARTLREAQANRAVVRATKRSRDGSAETGL